VLLDSLNQLDTNSAPDTYYSTILMYNCNLCLKVNVLYKLLACLLTYRDTTVYLPSSLEFFRTTTWLLAKHLSGWCKSVT